MAWAIPLSGRWPEASAPIQNKACEQRSLSIFLRGRHNIRLASLGPATQCPKRFVGKDCLNCTPTNGKMIAAEQATKVEVRLPKSLEARPHFTLLSGADAKSKPTTRRRQFQALPKKCSERTRSMFPSRVLI